MRGFRQPKTVIAAAMAAVMALTALPFNVAQAGLIGTDRIINGLAAEDGRAAIKMFLQREDVRRQLQLLGVEADEAISRVDAMADDQVRDVVGRIGTAPAGGDLGAVVGAIVIIFVVLLITDILGFTKIFPFTRPVKK
jgi:hypothetical protein